MIDLIDECGQDLSDCGYQSSDLGEFGMTSLKLFVDNKMKASKLGFDMGHYFIINAPKLSLLMPEHYDILKSEVLYRLKFLFKENKIKKKDKILFVGIGNPEILADCFGIFTVQKISISAYKKNNRVFKIFPNTFSNTGFNAYDIIHIIVETFDISAVVLIDSLATENIGRLGCSVQFNDSGLTPGSAINNFGKTINRSTLNVPCVAIGVPMMISSKSLGSKKDVVLAEKDVKEKVEFLSRVVADCFDEIML